jgi:negative regulator of sigma E activity
MNDALKIQISAFVDGELPNNESELLLRRLSQDMVLRQQVAQYLEIGRLIRNDSQVPGMDELRVRIAATLGDEISVDKSEQEIVGSRLMTPATGVAVAATVAALALVGLSQLDSPTEPNFDDAVAIDSAAVPLYTEPAAVDVLAESPNEQIQEYYRLHENSSDGLARVVNFELREGQLVEIEPDLHLSAAEKKTTSDNEIADGEQ